MTQIVTDERLIILGVILNGFGILFMTKGSSIGSNMAKEEIINEINHFKKEIQLVKQKTDKGESLQKIDALENEFNEWAANFLMNFEARQVAKKKSEILLNEKEIQLSKQWRHIYEYLLNTIQNMAIAYNEKSESRIEFNLPAIPNNLFNKEAESYRGWLIFNDNNAWVIKLQIVKPYNRDKISNVVIFFYHGENVRDRMKDGIASTFLLLSIDIAKICIEPRKGDFNQYIGDIKESYSIGSNIYKNEINELLKVIVEHQLVSL